MIEKLKDIILYGGLDKSTYHKYKYSVLSQDVKNLSIYLIVSGILFAVLGVVSRVSLEVAKTNSIVYFSTAGTMFATLLIQRLLIKLKGEAFWLHTVLIYWYMAIVYAQSGFLTIKHTDMLAVTYVCVLLMIPLLFTQRPLYTILSQSVSVVIFCILVEKFKSPDIAWVDIWNAITFFAISIVVVTIVVPIRLKSMVQAVIIKELSENDLLTGLKNRNCYENDFKEFTDLKEKPICIYADVNGLHELNNEQGHQVGDTMLKTVARSIKRSFGALYSYRIGGDEFVSFYFTDNLSTVEQLVHNVDIELADKGYHVSFGYAKANDEDEPFEKVVTRAEQRMYEAKKTYYQTTGKDRRVRR